VEEAKAGGPAGEHEIEQPIEPETYGKTGHDRARLDPSMAQLETDHRISISAAFVAGAFRQPGRSEVNALTSRPTTAGADMFLAAEGKGHRQPRPVEPGCSCPPDSTQPWVS